MRSFAPALVFILSTVAFGADSPATCQVADTSVVNRYPTGLAQVSNLGLIQITCHVAARPFPTKPGNPLYGLKAEVTVYQLSSDGSKSFVPSEVNVSGGGGDRSISTPKEWVYFYLNIPLDPTERDAEIHKLLANFETSLADEHLPPEVRQNTQESLRLFQNAPQKLGPLITQHRTGRFQVDCRVLDGSRVIGVGRVELEVFFEGHFADALLRKK